MLLWEFTACCHDDESLLELLIGLEVLHCRGDLPEAAARKNEDLFSE